MIRSSLVKVAGTAAQAAAVAPPGPLAAAPQDVARFQAAMAPPPEMQTTAHLLPVPPPADAPRPPASLGQAILDGLDGVRSRFDSTTTGIRHLLESTASDLTVRDMLSLQMQITTLSIQQDLMGKIVGKATQNVDQLLKAQ